MGGNKNDCDDSISDMSTNGNDHGFFDDAIYSEIDENWESCIDAFASDLEYETSSEGIYTPSKLFEIYTDKRLLSCHFLRLKLINFLRFKLYLHQS